MASNTIDHLKSLHTAAIDARSGYQEALKDAEGSDSGSEPMKVLFRDMIGLHDGHAGELARELTAHNEVADADGSFMSVVHKTIMDVRSMFNGLDESVLPGLIDGEKRNVEKYDTALEEAEPPSGVTSLLTRQRNALLQQIGRMEAAKAASERVS